MKAEIRGRRTEVRGRRTGDRSRGQRTEDRRQEDRGQRTEDRGQRTEDRGQRTEDRGQRTEDRGRRSEVGGQRSEDREPKTEGRWKTASVFALRATPRQVARKAESLKQSHLATDRHRPAQTVFFLGNVYVCRGLIPRSIAQAQYAPAATHRAAIDCFWPINLFAEDLSGEQINRPKGRCLRPSVYVRG